jgi:hypothetical protein
MLENSNYKLYCDRSLKIDWTLHNSRLDIASLDRTIKEAYLTDLAFPNSHNPTTPLARNSKIIKTWK